MCEQTMEMLSRTLCVALLALPVVTWAQNPTPARDDNEPIVVDTQDMSPDIAMERARDEANARAYLDACILDVDMREHFKLLSHRYVAYLAQFGRVPVSELETVASVRPATTPTCGVNEAGVLQSFRDRELSVRPLLDSPTPAEPAPKQAPTETKNTLEF